MEAVRKRDLFDGSLLKNIIFFTLPIIATSMLQLLFNTADLVVVGKFRGPDAVAAVGSTSALINLIVNLLVGLSVGASVTVAQNYGAKDDRAVSRSVHTAIAIALAGGILAGIVGVFFSPTFLRWMKTDPAVIDASSLYMRIYFIGVPASMLYNFGASILRAVGNTKTPLIYLSTAGIINVFLNVFLVAVCGMGVEGVAIATAVSQTVSAILVINYLAKSRESYRLDLRKLAFHKGETLRILKIGVPAGLQSSLFAISNVLIQSSVNSFGKIVVAGNTAAGTIEGFVYVLMNSFSNAAMTFVGQTVGAKRPDRIPAIATRCLLLVFGAGLIGGVSAYLFRMPLLSLFSSGENVDAAQAATYGALRMLFIGLPYFLCGLMDVLTGLLRGMGSSTVPMIITVVGVCVFRVAWIYTVFAAYRELSVLYLSYPVSWILTGTAQAILYSVISRRQIGRARKKEALLHA